MDNLSRLRMIVFVCVGLTFLGGCDPLHKKFVRKKKQAVVEDQHQPVFDPIDYPAVSRTNAEQYSNHFGLWKVWFGELGRSFEDNANDKKLHYILGQMQEQLAAMRSYLNEAKQKDADECLKDLEFFARELHQPPLLRNKVRLNSQIKTLGRKVRESLSLEQVKSELIATSSDSSN